MRLSVTENGMVDLAMDSDSLLTETTLESAVIISLLTDRRAELDDELPDDVRSEGDIPPDRRGWVGDRLSDFQNDRIGSRLWLLRREKQTEETRRRAESYSREALQWLIDDGHAREVEIEAAWAGHGRLDVFVDVVLINGSKYSSRLNAGSSNAV